MSVEYNVRCAMCGWSGDREDYVSLEGNRCPDCNAPAVRPDPGDHPEAYVESDDAQTSLGEHQ